MMPVSLFTMIYTGTMKTILAPPYGISLDSNEHNWFTMSTVMHIYVGFTSEVSDWGGVVKTEEKLMHYTITNKSVKCELELSLSILC